MAGVFEIFKGSDALYRFRLLDELGGVLATSEGFGHKTEAVAAISAVREQAAMGHIRDCSEPLVLLPHGRSRRRRTTV